MKSSPQTAECLTLRNKHIIYDKEKKMIERVKSIKNIGAYENSGNGSIKFKPFTYIYASNTYGKTTFCDVFRSLKTGESYYINNRRCIGATSKDDCTVDLTIDGKNISYANGSWSIPKDVKIRDELEIFDVNFVNDNFTNFEMEHKNKENLTSFILGERSVELISKLRDLENNLNEKKARKEILESFLTDHLEGISFDTIKNAEYREDFKEVEALMFSDVENIRELTDQINKVDAIKKINDIVLPSIDFVRLKSFIAQVKDTCAFDCKIDLTELQSKMATIKSENTEISETWIKEGVKYTKDTCPFCGMPISRNNRVQVFLNYFSKIIVDFLDKADALKDSIVRSFRSPVNDKYLQEACVQKERINKYICCEEFSTFEELADSLKNTLCQIEENCSFVRDELENNILQKLQSFTFTEFSFSAADKLLELFSFAEKTHSALLSCIDVINIRFGAYKTELSADSIRINISKLENDYNMSKCILLRGQFNDEIEELLQIDRHIAEIKAKIKKTRNDIDKQENDFLDTYFESIQRIFKELGGKNFSLKRKTDERGKKKVYGIEIYYKDTNIGSNRFSLSESDRRALALSIFLAKIDIEEKQNTILIMDDPITSFDQDRMRCFHLLLTRLRGRCFCQIILLMHYENYFRMLSKRTDEKMLIKITRQKDNHIFEEVPENDELLMDGYEKTLDKIIRFINADNNDISENDVRIFLDNYLRRYYAYESHKDSSLKGGTLHNFVVNLKTKRFISESAANDLTEMISLLNDTSHTFNDYTIEEKRSFVNSVYELLHSLGT